MHGYPSSSTVCVELDIQWRHMSIKGNPWGYMTGLAKRIIDRSVLIANGKLRSSGSLKVWNFGSVPCSKAGRVTIILTLQKARSPVQVAVEVQLFSGVVLVDCLATPLDIVDAIFNRVDTTRDGFLGNSYRVPQSPTKPQPR